MEIVPFNEEFSEAVLAIYKQGIDSRNATFETEVPPHDEWIKKFHPDLLWVAIVNDQAVGWAGLQPVSTRKAYEGVAEVTIYIDAAFTGMGIGTKLMTKIVAESEIAGIWTLYASIFPENAASINLHRRHGFREIGFRERIAQLDGKWRNTILFERRSKKVGL